MDRYSLIQEVFRFSVYPSSERLMIRESDSVPTGWEGNFSRTAGGGGYSGWFKSPILPCVWTNAPAAEASREEVQSATDRTTLWAEHCLQHWQGKGCDQDGRKLFGIVQGGRFEDLRLKSAEELIALNFPGYAIGGVSVGETEEEMLEQVKWVSTVLPEEKPRYVMGGGYASQLLQMVGMGADMFDCVMPSRAARHGMAFTQGRHSQPTKREI